MSNFTKNEFLLKSFQNILYRGVELLESSLLRLLLLFEKAGQKMKTKQIFNISTRIYEKNAEKTDSNKHVSTN